MNCREFEELAAAYALGAVSTEERVAAEAHLRECERHPEVAEYSAVAAGLAVAAPEKEPPPALKARLMDAVRAGPAPLELARPEKQSLLDSIRSWFTPARAGYAMSGVMAVLVAALLVWNISLQSDDDDGSGGQVVVHLSGAATGRVMYLPDERIAVMDVTDLEPLPVDQTYQVWAISDGQPVSLGLMSAEPSGHSTAAMVDIDLAGVDELAVTIEPAGGSPLPTSDPVLTGEI
jgi:anti-sigma-K factor RskA